MYLVFKDGELKEKVDPRTTHGNYWSKQTVGTYVRIRPGMWKRKTATYTPWETIAEKNVPAVYRLGAIIHG